MDPAAIVRAQPIVLAHEPSFCIGAAEIKPSTREIVHAGVASVVEPRVMQLLVALYRAEGGVVTKDDLIALCWEGRVVGEDAINRVVSRLRHEAAEKAGRAFRIETITKVGYRLIVDGQVRGSTATLPLINRRQAIAGGVVIAAAGGSTLAWRALAKPDWPEEARNLHEQGMAALRDGTVDQYASAGAKFRMEAAVAPGRPEPWGAMALAYQMQAAMAPPAQRQSLRARGAAAARRALSIDPSNGDALAASTMPIPLFRNWLAYEKAWRNVARRAPGHPAVNASIANLLSAVGRPREALEYIDRAVEADPAGVKLRVFKASLLWDTGRLEEAEEAFDQAFRRWPRNYSTWFSRYYFLAYNGRAQEALAMIADASGRPIGIPDWNFAATELQGRALANPIPSLVKAAMASASGLARRGVGFADVAIIFAGAMSQVDTAFSIISAYYFDRGFTLGDQRYSKEQGMYVSPRGRSTFFLFIPRTASLRRDRRFDLLTAELELDAYWRKSGSIPDYRT